MNRTILEVVDKLRYKSCGDYFVDGYGNTVIQIMKQSKPEYSFLIGLHEFGEEYLNRISGISEESVLKWDLDHPELDDPGSHKDSPYHDNHVFMMLIEKLFCLQMGISFDKYDDALIVSD